MIYALIISILFVLPTVSPVTHDNFNYAIVGVVLAFASLYWWISARKWFTGPKVQGTPEELATIEAELEAV